MNLFGSAQQAERTGLVDPQSMASFGPGCIVFDAIVQVCSELENIQAELHGAKAAQNSAEAAAREAQTATSERQKRFQHVHAKLKKDEDALKARVERFETEAAGYGEQIGAALQQADAAVQVTKSFVGGNCFYHE